MALEWYGFKDGEPRAVGQMESPLGPCTVVAGPDGLISLDWAGPEDEVAVAASLGAESVGAESVGTESVGADDHAGLSDDRRVHDHGRADERDGTELAGVEPVGTNAIEADAVDVTSVAVDADRPGVERAKQIVEDALEQLAEYFSGTRQHFNLPLSPQTGTEFQRAVWNYLLEIPYGETRSYGDVARAIGRDKAVRAVGQANRANPIPIVVPCHRVIGSNGALTGYAGSQVHLKAALLDLEQSHDAHD